MNTKVQQNTSNTSVLSKITNAPLLCFFPNELEQQAQNQFESLEKEQEVQHEEA